MEADGVDSGGSDSDVQSEPDLVVKTDEDGYSGKGQKDIIHCSSKFSKGRRGKRYLDAHMRIHIGGRFDCSFCDKRFKKRQGLLCHLKSHTVKRPFSCTVCGKQFIQNASLKCHMKIHSGDKPFRCTTCKRTFRSSEQVKIHKCTGESSDLYNNEPKITLGYPKAVEMFSSRCSQPNHKKTHLKKDAFICTECGMHFQFISQLKSHRIKHNRERQFGCSVCNRTFKWASQVKFHKCDATRPQGGSYKPKKMYSCSKCGETFSTSVLLIFHSKIHQEIFRCTECGMQFRYRSQLGIHMRKHTGEKPYSCTICRKRFSQIGITKQHMLVHSKEKPFSCNDCGRKFSWQFQVKRHTCSRECMYQIKSRRSETVRKENLNGDVTSLVYNRSKISVETEDSDNDFWNETRQHQSGVTYQRNKRHSLCEKEHITNKIPLNSSDDTMCEPKNADSVEIKFGKESRLLQSGLNVKLTGEASIRNAGSHPDERLRSSENSKGSEESHTLHIHLRHRIGEKPFGCTVCEKRFVTGGHLTRHTSVHTGERLLSCVVCKKSFSWESDLMSHECTLDSLRCYQSHTEEQVTANKLFSCSHCDEEFVLKQQLQMHTKRHMIKKNFRCSVCIESFARQEDLTFHVRSHIRCSVCKAVFSDRDSLVLHMRSHTLQTQFHCSVCDEKFAWRRHLIKHMEVHINEKSNNAGDQDDISVPQCSGGLSYSEGNSFGCPVCHACFSDKELFDQHTMMHTGTTRLCDFTQKRHLVKQIPVKENENISSCQNELTAHRCVHQSSNPDADLQPVVEEKALNSSDPDTDDSDFWIETRTHQSGDKSGKSKVFKSGSGFNRDKAPEYFKCRGDDNVYSDFWKETKKTQSNLTSDKDNEVSESESKIVVQQFLYREDLTQHKTFHTEVQGEIKQEDAKPSQIKEEKEETSITNFRFSPIPVKTEEHEEKPQCSQHHYSRTEVSRDSLRGPEAAKNSGQAFGAASFKSDESVDSDFWKETREFHSGLQSEIDDCKNAFSGSDDKASESLQPESDNSVDSDFWRENRKPQAVFDSKDNEYPNSEVSYEIKCKPYSCKECGKKCLYLSHYKRHMKQHTEKREFLCSICGNEFPYKSHLKIHTRTHTGEKPFSCPVCGKKYAQKASMQAHMVVHIVENQYSCDVCDKSFAWYTELKYHQCVGESSHKQL